MLKVRCPTCGKSASFHESDVGLPVVCLACGGRYVISDPSAAPPAEPAPVADATAHVPISGGLRVGRTFWIALALGAVAALLALALVLRALPDPVDRATALSLAEQARTAEAEGRLADAHRKYHELETIVAGRTIHDARTRRVVEQASRDERRVYDLLLSQVERQRLASAGASAVAGPASQPADQGQQAAAPTTAATAADPWAVAAASPPPATATAPAPPADPTASAASQPSGAPAQVAVADVAPSVPSTSPSPAPAIAAAPATAPATAPVAVATSGPSTATTTKPSRLAARPPIVPMPAKAEGITDEQIGQAIQKGVNQVLSRFDPANHTLVGADMGGADGAGLNALAVYALMQAGQAISDERLNVRGKPMDAMIEAMKDSRLRRGHAQTYATGIRATALALFNRPQDRAVLKQDVAALVQSHTQGAYTYEIDPNRSKQRYKGVWDNSNSQYGLLGVWAGAEAGVEVPGMYWSAVEQHWVETELPDGQWSYSGEVQGRLSMTAAGVASLFVTHDWLDAPKYARVVGRDPFSPALQRGLDWFEQGDHAVNLGSSYWGYTLYGIERVGLASGLKYFGQHDWYRQLATDVVAAQAGDGSWGDVPDTCFALLFLSRGRHPILMNKVRFSGYWANRPRDVANLTRFATHQLERELNWQVVPLRPANEWTDWLDSPILYLASHKEPKLVDQDYDNLRQFVAAGGLLFTHADGDDADFNRWAADLAHRLFPKYELQDLPADHSLYNLVYKIEDNDRPPLKAVSNGARLLMVHSTTDIAKFWQLRDTKGHPGAFRLGVNLFLYTTGKRDLRNKLDSTFVSDPGKPVNGSVAVARLEYPGNWDPEPAAWARFSRWFQRQTGTGVNVGRVKLAELKPGQARVAHLTGTARYDFAPEDVAAVKAFVESGGVLLVDQCGGTGTFAQGALETLLGRAFDASALAPLEPLTHPLFRAAGPTTGMDDLTKPRLRPFTADGKKPTETPISGFAAGKGHVIFTPLDVTSGLLGTRTWGIAGLHPDYAPPFVKNLIFWTMDGQAEK